jgi:hypothetical protein
MRSTREDQAMCITVRTVIHAIRPEGEDEMVWKGIVALAVFVVTVQAQELPVNASVTYLSSGMVYVSAGRLAGVQDSTVLFAVKSRDTIATLKVLAVSSKSASCRIVTAKRDLVVGDSIVGLVIRPPVLTSSAPRLDSAARSNARGAGNLSGVTAGQKEKPAISLQGRAGFQYFTTQFDNEAYNINQPGLALGFRATARDIPLSLQIYGNLRTLSRGGNNPFAGNLSNQSRIYRLSLDYDDHSNVMALGRILSYYAPSIGSIDGVSYARRVGDFLFGTSLGFQPDAKQQGVSTDTRKMVLFAHYENRESVDLGLTAAYARTYQLSQLDREAVSMGITLYASNGFSIYGYGDVDIRQKMQDRFELSPSISSGIIMVNYRVFDFLSVGAGVDASRLVYQYSAIQFMADSLVDRTLRSGATVSLNFMLPGGLGLYSTYTPRSSGGQFGKDYANVTTFSWPNVLSSGAMIRASLSQTTNSFTTSQGYGLTMQRNIFGADCSVRYQRSRYRIAQLEENNQSETLGGDIVALLTNRLSLLASFDRIRGYGSIMNSVFTELSWRF